MNKVIVIVSLMAISFGVIAVPVSGQEQSPISDNQVEAIVQQEEITTQDLGIENPGLLPTSPFYFLKEWRRGLIKIFTFNSVEKARLELQEANERAAEIKRLEEINSQNTEAIAKAVENYQRNMERLQNRLENLKETSQNPNVDKLLNNLVDRSLQHQRLFDNLKKKFEERIELRERLIVSQERIDETIAQIPKKFEEAAAFKQRLENIIKNQPERTFKELRAVEIIDRIIEKIPEQQQERIQEIKDNLIDKFENRIEKLENVDKAKILAPEMLQKLPGDQIQRVKILEEIKENLKPETRQKIEVVKEAILENKAQTQEIRREVVEKMINETKELMVKAREELKNISAELRQSIQQLLERAETHLVKAEKALTEDKLDEAFGQAVSASSNARNALRQINQVLYIKSISPNPLSPIRERKRKEVCIQVITPAISPTGECREFPTPCDVPEDWKMINQCPVTDASPQE